MRHDILSHLAADKCVEANSACPIRMLIKASIFPAPINVNLVLSQLVSLISLWSSTRLSRVDVFVSHSENVHSPTRIWEYWPQALISKISHLLDRFFLNSVTWSSNPSCWLKRIWMRMGEVGFRFEPDAGRGQRSFCRGNESVAAKPWNGFPEITAGL